MKQEIIMWDTWSGIHCDNLKLAIPDGFDGLIRYFGYDGALKWLLDNGWFIHSFAVVEYNKEKKDTAIEPTKVLIIASRANT